MNGDRSVLAKKNAHHFLLRYRSGLGLAQRTTPAGGAAAMPGPSGGDVARQLVQGDLGEPDAEIMMSPEWVAFLRAGLQRRQERQLERAQDRRREAKNERQRQRRKRRQGERQMQLGPDVLEQHK